MATLITGGAGFIGLEVVRLLIEKGEKRPVIFSRNPVREHLGDLADQVDIIRGDLGNFSHVLHAVKQARPEVILPSGSHVLCAERGRSSGGVSDQRCRYLSCAGSGAPVRGAARHLCQFEWPPMASTLMTT